MMRPQRAGNPNMPVQPKLFYPGTKCVTYCFLWGNDKKSGIETLSYLKRLVFLPKTILNGIKTYHNLKNMGKISIQSLQPGMVLADDASANGQALLAKGSTVTEKHIKTFKAWGLTEIDIEGSSEAGMASKRLNEIDPKLINEVESRLRHRFLHCDLEHPAIKSMFTICVLREINKT